MFHLDCDGTILMDVTSCYKLLANVTSVVGSSHLNTVEIHVYNVSEVCDKAIYWCTNCDCEVSLDEVCFSCRICGTSVSIDTGRLTLETGGIYCESCFEGRCGEEDCREMSDLFTPEVQIKLT